MTRQARRITTGVVAGVAGGLLASWAMDEFQTLASKAQGRKPAKAGAQNRKPANAGQNEEPATVKIADSFAANILHRKLAPEEKKVAGSVAHYAMGGVSGGIYGAMAAVVPGATLGFGTLFGAALWLLADEVAVPALGLSKKPSAYSLGKHAMALASHLVYGLTTDGTRRAIEAVI